MAQADPPTAHSSLAERYRVLLDIGHKLAGALSSQSLYRSIYEETARILEASGFYLSLYDREKDLATVVFYADKGVERDVSISYRGSDSDVLRLGEGTLILDRVESRPLMVLGEDESDITRAAITAPLLYEGEVVGAISTQSYESNTYREEDLELLQGIADLAAVAINNAQHVAELEKRRLEAERIEVIGRAITSSLDTKEVLRAVIDAVLELFQADGSTVWLMEGDLARVAASGGKIRLEEGEILPLTDEIRKAIVDERQPLVVEDLSGSTLLPEGLRPKAQAGCGLLVPLILNNEVAGGLSAGRLQEGRIGQEEVDVLLRLASQASVALANARLHADIRALSLTDALTDLPNRRHLDLHLRREVAAARRGRPVCVVLFDLDDFKSHNDNLGHVVGDQILRSFGRILLGETRAMNLAARYGGDEFISVLTEIPVDGAVIHAGRVIKRVMNDPDLSRYGVTVSYGIGEFDSSTMFEVEDLVKAADDELYRSKVKRGRNPGTRSNPPASEPTG
jgi:diguanylate cyclase (GGDEF)-like protein